MADKPAAAPTEMPESAFRQSDAFRELKDAKRQRDREEWRRVKGAAAEAVADAAGGRPSIAGLTRAVAESRGPVRRVVEWSGIAIGLVVVAAIAYWGIGR